MDDVSCGFVQSGPYYVQSRSLYPLQDSCLENPTDGGAWWAAVHGVAQSRARLKGLSSSSSSSPMAAEGWLRVLWILPTCEKMLAANMTDGQLAFIHSTLLIADRHLYYVKNEGKCIFREGPNVQTSKGHQRTTGGKKEEKQWLTNPWKNVHPH